MPSPPAPRLSDLPSTTTLDHLLAQLGSVEHGQLDFKREPARLNDLIPALAMTEGGLIVLGINDDRTLHGCELTQTVANRITRPAKDVGVDIQVREITVDGRPVVVIAVPEVRGRIVTTTDGRLLRRVGGDISPLVGDQLARFVREREDLPGEEEPIATIAPRDFDLAAVNAALEQDGRHATSPAEVMRALVDLDVAVPQPPPLDPKITTAAVVLFAQRPEQFVRSASVQLVRRLGVGPGAGPTEAREEHSLGLAALVDVSLDFISRHTRTYQLVVGTRRSAWPEYPEEVLREALLNAFAHRDYGRRGTTVDVTIWDDRIEIRSPGGLPGPITLDNIRTQHYSRNRRVMRVLKSLGLVEEYGEGVGRMFDLMDARLMEPPVISPTPDSVTVTLRNRFLVSVEDQAWLSLLGNLQLTGDERRVLALVRREGSLTRRHLGKLLPGTNVDPLIRGAIVKGLIERTGQRGGARYVLSPEMRMRAGASGLEAQSRKRQTLLDEVHRQGSLSTAEGAELLQEDSSTVRELLNDLASAGLVEARGQTRARRYHRR